VSKVKKIRQKKRNLKGRCKLKRNASHETRIRKGGEGRVGIGSRGKKVVGKINEINTGEMERERRRGASRRIGPPVDSNTGFCVMRSAGSLEMRLLGDLIARLERWFTSWVLELRGVRAGT